MANAAVYAQASSILSEPTSNREKRTSNPPYARADASNVIVLHRLLPASVTDSESLETGKFDTTFRLVQFGRFWVMNWMCVSSLVVAGLLGAENDAPPVPATPEPNVTIIEESPALEPYFVGDGGRKLFQSDRAFENFIGPVSSPILSKDPRSLTELRPCSSTTGSTDPILWGAATSKSSPIRGCLASTY
ncbi:MAG: hypothetical protein U1D30_05920 [Planctomycetota bacterium]